jgi:membrane protease YdiL (CAAX protease family)
MDFTCKTGLMKSATISSLLLSVLIGACTLAAAIFVHNPGGGILVFNICFFFAAFLIGFGIERHPPLLLSRQLWSLDRRHRKVLWISLTIAAALGCLDRYLEGMPLVPEALEWFVLVSMLIGATEEIIFRGIIQGEAARWNPGGAIFLGAFVFAAYKALLFVWPGEFNQANPWIIFLVTFPAGILLGYARKITGSLWPAILAHMLFDLVLYGDAVDVPWWVWR